MTGAIQAGDWWAIYIGLSCRTESGSYTEQNQVPMPVAGHSGCGEPLTSKFMRGGEGVRFNILRHAWWPARMCVAQEMAGRM